MGIAAVERVIHDIEPAFETVTPPAVVVVDVKSSIVTGVGGFEPLMPKYCVAQ